MRVPRWTSTLPLLGGALLLALFPMGCSDDDNPASGGGGGGSGATLPASWAGTWQITSIPVAPAAPERGGPGGPEVSLASFCEGTAVEEFLGDDEFAEFGGTCTGTWTDAAVDVTCTGSMTDSLGCTETFSVALRLNRSDELFSGTLTTSFVYTGTCDEKLEDELYVTDIDAIRIDTSQFGCDASLDRELPVSWGGNWTVVETPAGPRGENNQLLCPGTDIEDIFWRFGEDADAVGGFTETTAQVSGSYTEDEGTCLRIQADQYDLTRSDGSFSGTKTSTVYRVENPGGGGSGGECTGEPTSEIYNITGMRTDTDVTNCGGDRSRPERRRFSLQDLMRLPASRR